MCHRLMCTWLPGTEKGASRGYRLGIARAPLNSPHSFQIWSVDTVVFCRKAAHHSTAVRSWSQQRGKRNSASSHWCQWKHSSATTIICHKEASLNNSSGEINSAERQSKWRKFKWRVNENMQGQGCEGS